MAPDFFFSYARADDTDFYVRKFHNDLCAAVDRLLGHRPQDDNSPTGFRDGLHVPVGTDWSTWIGRMLATCRCMVACYSDAYFRSAHCSREIGVLIRRMRVTAVVPDGPVPGLVPVLWEPVPIPKELTAFQYTTDLLGHRYQEVGMRRLLLERHIGPDYRDAVEFIARQVAQASQAGGPAVLDVQPFGAGPLSFSPRGAAVAGSKPSPKVWRVPSRNAQFTGRDALLAALSRGFRDDTAAGRLPQVLTGIGGVGKTQTAVEYAYCSAEDYDLVWYLDASQPELVRRELAEMAVPLGLNVSTDIPTAAASVLEALRRGEPCQRWLVVMDNAEQPEALRGLIPSGAGHVLLTSRDSEWDLLASQLDVTVFTREESIRLLRHINGTLSQEDAARIGEILGDLPLSVAQATALLRLTGMPASVYLDLLDQRLPDVLSEPVFGGYPHSATATWLLAYDRLRSLSPAAARLLTLCAFLGPAPIPTEILYTPQSAEIAGAPTGPLEMARLVREINRHGIARLDPDNASLSVHRLVQQVLRNRVPEPDRAGLRAEAQAILGASDPGEPDNPATWDRYATLLPHLTPSRAQESTDDGVRQWIVNSVRYLWRRSDLTVAESVAEQAYAVWQPVFGDDDPLVLHLRAQWGNALRFHGRLAEAYELGLDVYRRAEATLGPEDPITLVAAAGYAADLRAVGNYGRARSLDAVTYSKSLRVFGEHHPRTLMMANNLAQSISLTGDYRGAREARESVWEKRRRLSGPDHPDTAATASNYAYDLRETGSQAAAQEIAEQAVADLRRLLGEQHSYTLGAMRNLAGVLRRCGDYTLALEAAEDAYSVACGTFGERHPHTLSGAVTLACARSASGEAKDAHLLAEATFTLYDEQLGPRHPLTLVSGVNLAVYRRAVESAGDPDILSVESLTLLREVLGDRHPYTLAAMVNQASCLAAAGIPHDAVALGREALAGLEAAVGERHPDTIGCLANLAADLRLAERREEGQAYYAQAMERSRAALGPAHPVTTLILRAERIDCLLEPPET
ncbi:FxSxx-COOH system tetratricopeptide repeat protein [Streptacidiphilus sp. PAMC 29251]